MSRGKPLRQIYILLHSSVYFRLLTYLLWFALVIATIPKSVIFVYFSLDEKQLLTVDGKYEIYLWNAITGANIRQIVESYIKTIRNSQFAIRNSVL